MQLATIPSPAEGVWHLGPLPLRAYALMIILGIVVAVWIGERRWIARGGTPGVIIDVAIWAVPFGLVGGRLYHVITDWQRYFGEDGDPIRSLQIWQGGLGIWGAITLGGIGAWIGCRRRGVSVLALGDAIAPGLALAQAIGRWGNWWNQELYGRPLDTWWALEIDPDHRPKLSGTDILDPRYADVATYHPTFLYESLWCVVLALVVVWAGRRYKLTHGRTFAVYVAGYTLGRFWIEWLRIDEAHHILGLRLNDWTSMIVFAGAVAYLYLARTRTGPEAVTVQDLDAPAFPDPPADDKPVADAPEPGADAASGMEDEPASGARSDRSSAGEAPGPEAGADVVSDAAGGPASGEEPEPEPDAGAGADAAPAAEEPDTGAAADESASQGPNAAEAESESAPAEDEPVDEAPGEERPSGETRSEQAETDEEPPADEPSTAAAEDEPEPAATDVTAEVADADGEPASDKHGVTAEGTVAEDSGEHVRGDDGDEVPDRAAGAVRERR